MKSQVLLLLGCLFMLSSCNNTGEPEEAALNDSSTVSKSKAPPQGCKYCPDVEPEHGVELSRLHGYFSGFMRRYGVSLGQDRPGNFGGAFSPASFENNAKLLDTYPVSTFYPVAEEAPNGPRFFLAMKQVDDCNTPGLTPGICEQLDDLNAVSSDRDAFGSVVQRDIRWPTAAELPNGPDCSENDFVAYLRSLRFSLDAEDKRYALTAQPASGVLVNEMKAFRERTLSATGNEDYPSRAFVFSKQKSIRELLNIPNVVSVGYFFGYDNSPNAVHKIRLILFGIELDGSTGQGKIAFVEDTTSAKKSISWARSFREYSSPKP